MNRRLIVICAVMFLVAFAVPAFAAVQNVKVSGDITATGIFRDNFDLGRAANNANTAGGDDDSNVVMSQVRLRVDADLTDNVSATIRLLNERDWDEEDNASTDVDLDLAYITLKEMLYSPLTVIIGRQNLRYGNAMIIGDPNTSRQEPTGAAAIFNDDLSIRKAFDAVRALLNYDPLVLDLFYAKLDENDKIGAGTTLEEDDIDLWGGSASYKVGDKYNSMVEAYFFQKRDDTKKISENENAEVVNVPGFRIVTNPIKGLNISVEQAWQFGNENTSIDTNRSRKASALQFISSYALQYENLMKYSPVIGIGYTRFSGDKNPADNINSDYYAWDPMYNDQGIGTIYNVLFDKTNIKAANFNVSAKPIEDVTVRVDWTNLYLDRKLNTDVWGQSGANVLTLYQQNGGSYTPTMSEDATHLGHEIDALLTYDYTEDVQFNLLMGWFIPGGAFDDNNRQTAKEIIGSCKVAF